MTRSQAVRLIAAAAPRRLRVLRGKLMFEELCETLGVEEVACPACCGSGWLDRANAEFCPLCRGFREVPDGLADWFQARLAHLWGCRQRWEDEATAPVGDRPERAALPEPLHDRERVELLGEMIYVIGVS